MKYFHYKGQTFTNDIPDPLDGISPLHKPDGSVNEARFKSMCGEVSEDSEMTPKEKFFHALDTYLAELKAKADALALNISIDEFKEAAGSMISSELIAWAKSKQVPDEMIEIVRPQILTFIADASRLGMTWGDIFPKAEVSV